MPSYRTGNHTHSKGYLRISAGPLRNLYVHRVVAEAMIGRELGKDVQVHHLDGDKRNCRWSNLMLLGINDHGWVSAKQSYYMQMKEIREKEEWDQWMRDRDREQREEIRVAKVEGKGWECVDGRLEPAWIEYRNGIAQAKNAGAD